MTINLMASHTHGQAGHNCYLSNRIWGISLYLHARNGDALTWHWPCKAQQQKYEINVVSWQQA